MAGVSQTTVRKWLKKDPKFAARVQRARDVADDRIRQELHRRAVIGVKEGVWFKGRLVGHQKKYSDRLLQLLAASRFPEFRQKTELTGEGGGPLTIKVVYDQEVDKDVPPEDVVDGEYRSLT